MAFRNTKTPTMDELREGKQKYTVPKRRTKCGLMEFYIPDEMVEQFKKHVRDEMNRTVMEWYGISFSTLQRFKRELGVVKDMAKVRHKQAMLTKRICEKNGYYESLRGKKPTEQCYEAIRKMRAEGFHPMTRLKEINPRKYKRICKQRSAMRKELIETEKRHYDMCLLPLTNLRANIYNGEKYTRQELCARNNAKKKGYIVGSPDPDMGERHMIYYTEKMQRWPKFEQSVTSHGFEVRHINQRHKVIAVL